MTAEVIYNLFRFGFLILLWFFLLLAIYPLRSGLNNENPQAPRFFHRAQKLKSEKNNGNKYSSVPTAKPHLPSEISAVRVERGQQIDPRHNAKTAYVTPGGPTPRSQKRVSITTPGEKQLWDQSPAAILHSNANRTDYNPTRLTIVAGDQKGVSCPLDRNSILLGRSRRCDIPLTDTFASGQHARIYKLKDQWYVEDLNSTNGTFVNEKQIKTSVPLSIGVPVRIGQTILELIK